MPMFDDPRKELNRLQAELLAQEEEEYPEENRVSGDFDEELDDILALIREEKEEYPRQEPIYRNYANNYGRRMPDVPTDEDGEEDHALYADEYEPRKKKKKKEKGIRGLVFLAILETLGILAIAAWWVKFLWM